MNKEFSKLSRQLVVTMPMPYYRLQVLKNKFDE